MPLAKKIIPDPVLERNGAPETTRDAFRRVVEMCKAGAPETQPGGEATEKVLRRWGPFVESMFDALCSVPRFPLHVFPSVVRRYVKACAQSIHCPGDLLAVPLLAVAGAATGRSGRRLQVKDGWKVSSCLWTAGLTDSGGGKTPALNAVLNFFDDRQEIEHLAYQKAKEAHAEDSEKNPRPGPYPSLKLTNTTMESLCADLKSGPLLFARDELGAWCHQMGQYKQGNSDRFEWCSLWSHSPVNIGRKTADRVYVKDPFVAVTGMMVPASARELNYRGQADDGFVHRMLIAYPEAMPPVATLEGVPDDLASEYKRRMARLFDPPASDDKTSPSNAKATGSVSAKVQAALGKTQGGEVQSGEARGSGIQTFEPQALRMVLDWANLELYAGLKEAPGWLVSKHRKLFENCLRLCLVLHELWRVAGEDWELRGRDFYGERVEFRENVVDRVTAERAIAVVEYFRAHIDPVQSLLGEEVDEVDRLYNRLRPLGEVTTRTVIHKTSYKSQSRVLALFAEWRKRGYGEIKHPRKNQTAFTFGE